MICQNDLILDSESSASEVFSFCECVVIIFELSANGWPLTLS